MLKEKVKLENLEPTIRKILKEGGTFRFAPRGTSMQPFIWEGRYQVVIGPLPEGKLKKYQIVLYKRKNGAYVLHRIIEVKKDSYTMRGDNQFIKEKGIKKEQMIGVVIGIICDGKEQKLEGIAARGKVKIWVKTAFLRRVYRKIRGILGF